MPTPWSGQKARTRPKVKVRWSEYGHLKPHSTAEAIDSAIAQVMMTGSVGCEEEPQISPFMPKKKGCMSCSGLRTFYWPLFE